MDSKDLVGRIEEELGSTPTQDVLIRPSAPPRVADHELVRRIGAGSYGEVWLARSVTGQWRAVKVVARARFESDRPFEREFRGVVQFEPISRSHSGLIQVLHVGRDDAAGAFYYVMELADGEKPAAGAPENRDRSPDPTETESSQGPGTEAWLANYRPRTLRSELNAHGRLPVAEVVAFGIQLAGALGHIHRHGLVHRDVKPSNVIFVEGQPKLADLGLVATTHEARSFVGTEGFIPPEGPGTVKSDLFALGRLLYEAATGKDRCEYPEVPADLDTWPDRDAFLELNEVLARLCDPEPRRRCDHAAEAAGDLNLLLAGRSVRRAYGIERRLRRASQFSAVVLGVLAVAAGLVWVQEVRQRRAEAQAAAERTLRERAQAAEHESRDQLYTALLEQARATVRSGELGQRVRALDAIRRAAAIRNTAELRREGIAALALPDLPFERELPWESRFTARQLDPAFQRIAVGQGRGSVEVHRVSDNAILATLPAATNLMCFDVAWSRSGRFLAVKREHESGPDGFDLEVWDLDAAPRRVLSVRDSRLQAFHPHRPIFVSSDADGRVLTWDLERGGELGRFTLDGEAPTGLAFSPDGSRFAVAHPGRETSVVAVYDSHDAKRLASGFLNTSAMSFAWHPAGAWLAVTDRRGVVHLMDARTGALRVLGRHRAEAVSAVFDRSGDYLITGGWERSLICWDLRTMQPGFVVELDSYNVQMSDDGRTWALLTPQGVRLHSFELPLQRRFAEDLGSRLRFAAFSPDGRWLAASADERLGIWDLTHSGEGALADAGAETMPYWTADGGELFASRDDICLRWQVVPSTNSVAAPALRPIELPMPEGFAWLSLLSNQVAWTSAKGSRIDSLTGLPGDEKGWARTVPGINGLSPDGRWLGIFRGYTPVLHVYRRPGLEPVARLVCRANIAGFQFSPAGDEVAVASRGQVEFWSTRNWERTRELTNFAGIPHIGLLVQPDGRGWWLAQEQRFACLYEAHSLAPQLPLPSAMSPLAVSPDGRQLAVSVAARQLEVWDLSLVRTHLRNLGLDWAEAP